VTLGKKVVLRQFVQANTRILAGTDPELNNMNPENDSEMNREAEQRTMQRMAKVHGMLQMWQGSQNLHGALEESRVHNKQMTTMGYTSDTE